MIDLYLAGEYQFKLNDDMYLDIHQLKYNRLLSYGYQQTVTDKIIKWMGKMDLFFAGSDKLGLEERRRVLDLFLVGPEKENVMDKANTTYYENISNGVNFILKSARKRRILKALHYEPPRQGIVGFN